MNQAIAGSGIHYGRGHATRHVEHAVAAAMESAQLDQVMGLILFLTDDHLPQLSAALRAAARVARCTQVFGCSAMGLFTDQDWTVDSSAAAALVLGNGATVRLGHTAGAAPARLALGTPRDASAAWLAQCGRSLGALASDSLGRGPFRVWNHGRVADAGVAVCTLDGIAARTVLARGIQALTEPMQGTQGAALKLARLDGHAALDVLRKALPESVRRIEPLALHLIMCGITSGDPDTAIRDNRYRLAHIVAAHPEDRSLTLADELGPGERLFFALRERTSAQRDLQRLLEDLPREATATPDFGLMFSCLGRGPGFYGGRDRDVETLRERFPGMPFAGFYGNGEIAPFGDAARLFSYSAAIGLYRRH